MSRQTLIEKLALSILARDGVAAIWKLNEAAADAHRTEDPRLSARERLLNHLITVGKQVGVAGYPLA